MVKTVHQQHVHAAARRRHKPRTVTLKNFKMRVVVGHAEVTAQRDHVRVDLYHRDAAGG